MPLIFYLFTFLLSYFFSTFAPRMKIEDFEIMAPVGSRESLAAAIQAGADSIYFGIEKLNMRAHSASVFTIATSPVNARNTVSRAILP